MSRLAAALLAALAVALVAVPLWLTVQGAGASRVTSDERTVRSTGSRSVVFIGGGVRSGK